MIYKAELQKKVFFPHPFNCQRRFSNEKVGNRKKLSLLFTVVHVGTKSQIKSLKKAII